MLPIGQNPVEHDGTEDQQADDCSLPEVLDAEDCDRW